MRGLRALSRQLRSARPDEAARGAASGAPHALPRDRPRVPPPLTAPCPCHPSRRYGLCRRWLEEEPQAQEARSGRSRPDQHAPPLRSRPGLSTAKPLVGGGLILMSECLRGWGLEGAEGLTSSHSDPLKLPEAPVVTSLGSLWVSVHPRGRAGSDGNCGLHPADGGGHQLPRGLWLGNSTMLPREPTGPPSRPKFPTAIGALGSSLVHLPCGPSHSSAWLSGHRLPIKASLTPGPPRPPGHRGLSACP